MPIHELSLKNYRYFETLKIQFGKRLTLLAGGNGTGKSNILESLVVGLHNLFHPLLGQGAPKINKQQVHMQIVPGTDPAHMAPQYPSCVTLSGTTDVSYEMTLEQTSEVGSPKRFYEPKNFTSAMQQWDPQKTLPLLACYWSQRTWIDSERKFAQTAKPSARQDGYAQWFDAASDITGLFLWFKTQEMITLQRTQPLHIFEVVRQAMIRFLPGVHRVYWDIAQDALTLVTDKGALPFNVLSDGYRNMLAMVGTMAYRAALLNPQLGDRVLDETEGVVLMDELDLHLHPKWQQNVAGDLMKTFPKVQFIATTHSPFIIQSIQTGSDVRLINLDDQGDSQVEWMSLEEVAEEIQGVEQSNRHPRYKEMMEAAEHYHAALKEAKTAPPERLESLRKRLDELAKPYGDDPAYQAFLNMERQAANIDRSNP